MSRDASPRLDEPAGRLQYSLRSLLVVMTFCCLALSLLQHVSLPAWGLGMLGVVAWSGVVAGQGASALAAAAGYRGREREEDIWLLIRRRWAVLFAAVGVPAPAATFLLAVGAFSCASLDVDRFLACVDPAAGAAESGWRGAWLAMWTALLLLNPGSALLNAMSCSCYFRPREDLALLLVRAFGLLSSLTATFVTFGLYTHG